jgi:hypothetical protein
VWLLFGNDEPTTVDALKLILPELLKMKVRYRLAM